MKYFIHKDILLIIIGNFILALSVSVFTIPLDITVGGTTGVSIIFHYLFQWNISIIVLIINIICLILGYLFIGKEVVFKSILSSILYPFFLSVFQQIPNISNITQDILFASVAGGCFSGIGVGLAIKSGATIDGMEILSIILNRKKNFSIGKSMYIIDTMIMIGQLPFYQFDHIFYGVLSAYILTYMIHKVLSYGTQKEQVFIYSKKHEILAKELIDNDFGLTLFDGYGGFQNNKFKVINMTVFSKELPKLKLIIDNIDKTAFITIHPVSEVAGRGFTLEKINKRSFI